MEMASIQQVIVIQILNNHGLLTAYLAIQKMATLGKKKPKTRGHIVFLMEMLTKAHGKVGRKKTIVVTKKMYGVQRMVLGNLLQVVLDHFVQEIQVSVYIYLT
jgi:hypothetical protein